MTEPRSYYVWVTAISDTYTEQLVGRLVRRGWGVSIMSNTLSALMSFTITKASKGDKPEDEITLAKAIEEVIDVMKVLGAKYHSIVVTETCRATWILGNITNTEVKKAEEERRKATN